MRIKKHLETRSSCGCCGEQQSLETQTDPKEHNPLQTKHFPIPRLHKYNNTKPHLSLKFFVHKKYSNNNYRTNS